MNLKPCILLFSFILGAMLNLATAQDMNLNSDPHTDPHTFNPDFDGIGPKVYIVPPPKSEAELLTEKYVIKKESQYQIDSLLFNINLEKGLRRFNTTVPSFLVKEGSVSEETQILAIIDYYKKENNEYFLSNWQNNLAVHYFLLGMRDKAVDLFYKSLDIKNRLGTTEEQFVVLNNLALSELENGSYHTAVALYEELAEKAKKAKDIDHQALSHLALAKLEAKSGNYTSAHNIVIKKSIPLFQRIKNYHEVVRALNELASFKEMETNYTEAKWIYLQAASLAEKYDDENGKAISFFNLAQLKNKLGDNNLAISDYLTAKELAIKNNMDDLLVEIHDGLGDAYLKSNDYKAAAVALNEYHFLKDNLLNQHLLHENLTINQ